MSVIVWLWFGAICVAVCAMLISFPFVALYEARIAARVFAVSAYSALVLCVLGMLACFADAIAAGV